MDDDRPVFICSHCKRGFLTMPPNRLDSYPIWAFIDGPMGDECWGEIRIVRRSVAMREAQNAKLV